MKNKLLPRTPVPRIESLKVKNYRALKDLHLNDLTPLTVLLGPNGSGKSTVFDVFAFLSECFSVGLRKAWDKRGRFRELRTRGAAGPIEFEIKYREAPGEPLITYQLIIDESQKGPYIAKELLMWRRTKDYYGKPFAFLNFQMGKGTVVAGEQPDEVGERVKEELASPEMLAVNTLGQLAKHPRVTALRRFISEWYLSYINADNTRSKPDAGPQERLSISGDNLPNVIQYLNEQHPARLKQILKTLTRRIPRLQKIYTEIMKDGSLLLQIKDAPFKDPILSKFASDGTLKMLAYLTVLYDPLPPQLIGIEEPENQLHPRLLIELAEECRSASSATQLMVTTHSPFFVNGLHAKELFVLYRNHKGFTKAVKVSEIAGINVFMQEGALLGDLWMEGHFGVGDPFTSLKRKVRI